MAKRRFLKWGLKLMRAKCVNTHTFSVFISQLNSHTFLPGDLTSCSNPAQRWSMAIGAESKPSKHIVPDRWFSPTRHWLEMKSRPDPDLVNMWFQPKGQTALCSFSVSLKTANPFSNSSQLQNSSNSLLFYFSKVFFFFFLCSLKANIAHVSHVDHKTTWNLSSRARLTY